MERRRYSDVDKATALAVLDANGGNMKKTATQIGIPLSTLKEWRDGRVNDDVAELRNVKRDEISTRLKEIVHLLIDAIPGKIPEASLQQITTSIGIAVDKAQLLEGSATERTEVIDNISDDERANRVAAILERARARATGQVAE